MTAADAYARLTRLGVPAFETADAAAALGTSGGAAHKILARLADAGLLTRVFHGLWSAGQHVDPLVLPDHLTAPFPSYVSLQTALYHHGLIEQIPVVIYVVSIGRNRRLTTTAGTFAIHHVTPQVFGGFEMHASGVKLATPEKALFDVLYLSGKRTREFSALPEVELPRGFRWSVVRDWLGRVTSPRDRAIIERRIRELRPSSSNRPE